MHSSTALSFDRNFFQQLSSIVVSHPTNHVLLRFESHPVIFVQLLPARFPDKPQQPLVFILETLAQFGFCFRAALAYTRIVLLPSPPQCQLSQIPVHVVVSAFISSH
ncbi:aspartate aminotransferase protein [Colletotrichum scovillei]|uniref:Aspartate aminotransferase protein n=1 Tax=Colletotrichum scovillei TaxID=1209932 RepID=A0A9P7U7D7_9PEZI|nr:aspartate aminotransferase protein [Colletotrichum scovillei]KAG7042463.1 aspartate aminotransferase protein [Colletotrichum scovillei]KAG7062496.1 aspartate aminotransferase protein [Colletotrichum scovillei]